MKRILLLIILMLSLLMPDVYADNYDLREVVPKDIQTSVDGEKLFYKNIKYDNGIITMDYIRNNTYEELKPTVTIILFDKDKLSIGVVNYCDQGVIIPSKTNHKDIKINASDYKFAKGSSIKDVEYYAVYNENTSCKQNDYADYYGKKIEDIGTIDHYDVNANTNANYLIYIVVVLGAGLLFLFVYKFVFTNEYRDMNGDDTRKAYEKVNEENLIAKEARDKDAEAARNKQKAEEAKAKAKQNAEIYVDNSEGNDLENMYK